jgi:hypothetical protein
VPSGLMSALYRISNYTHVDLPCLVAAVDPQIKRLKVTTARFVSITFG